MLQEVFEIPMLQGKPHGHKGLDLLKESSPWLLFEVFSSV